MGTSHWFLDQNNFFLFFLLYFTPRGTTNNLPLLNTQNRPTLVYRGCTTVHPTPSDTPSLYKRSMPQSMSALSGLKSSAGGIRLDFFFSSQCISNLWSYSTQHLWAHGKKSEWFTHWKKDFVLLTDISGCFFFLFI